MKTENIMADSYFGMSFWIRFISFINFKVRSHIKWCLPWVEFDEGIYYMEINVSIAEQNNVSVTQHSFVMKWPRTMVHGE